MLKWNKMRQNIPDGCSLLGNLTTIGRVSGKRRTVKLRLVFYEGKFYASRKNTNGDWVKNIVINPSVMLDLYGEKIEGRAELVKDEKLSRKISELKYSDERREEKRVVVKLTPE